jgi:hypothetical protein
MRNKDGKYDNELLVEYNFLVNYDIAMFRYVKSKFSNSPYVDKSIISMEDDTEINKLFLYRKQINPLTVIMPEVDSDPVYKTLLETQDDMLRYFSTLYDTFYLLNTFLDNASSVSITVRCDTEDQKQYLLHLGCRSNVIVEPDRKKIDLSQFTAIYLKYYMDAIKYGHIEGKHIYIANAKFNFEHDKNAINIPLSVLYADLNHIKLMDLFTKIKYFYTYEKEEELIEEGVDKQDDLLEHSSGTEGEADPEGYAWYNF